MQTKTKRIVLAALMASLTYVATIIIKIPSPLKGYLNLGDCLVLVTGWILPPMYSFLAAGLGSALADVFSGYIIYAPATFFIKGTMAVIAWKCFVWLRKKLKLFPSRVISGIASELVMILGYFLFEGFLYGFIPSLVNIPANGIQGVAGLLIGIPLSKLYETWKISANQD